MLRKKPLTLHLANFSPFDAEKFLDAITRRPGPPYGSYGRRDRYLLDKDSVARRLGRRNGSQCHYSMKVAGKNRFSCKVFGAAMEVNAINPMKVLITFRPPSARIPRLSRNTA